MEEEETRAGTVVVTSRGLAGWLALNGDDTLIVTVPTFVGCNYYEYNHAWSVVATPPETARVYISLKRWQRWRPYWVAGQATMAVVVALALVLDALARMWGG